MSGRGFNLQDYATVDDRITKYWAMHPKPEGSIQTEILWVSDDGNSVAIRATVYQGERILATGIAQEERGSKGANSTSWWENCETSAIGRALANMDMSLSKNRPSRQEMEKVERYEDAADPPPGRTLAEADRSGVGHGRRDTAHPPPQLAVLTEEQEKVIAQAWDMAEAGDTYGATKALVLTLKGAASEDEWREINRRWFTVRVKHYPMTVQAAQPAAYAG